MQQSSNRLTLVDENREKFCQKTGRYELVNLREIHQKIKETSDEIAFEQRKIRFKDRLLGIAEGDSWFDYAPSYVEDITRGDLINQLNQFGDFNILRKAKAGDTLENMIFGTDYDDDYQPEKSQFDKTLKLVEKHQPHFLLFSGGGNDVAGEEIEAFLNHADSGLNYLRDDYLNYMLNKVFKKYFKYLIKKVTEVAPNIHIFIHGYGYSIPDGKAVIEFNDLEFIGPWLRPAFAKKRIEFEESRQIVNTIIDAFNKMLADLDTEYDHVHHINLLDIIKDDDWANELHLNVDGYEKVAQVFKNEINEYVKK